jgi:hypothetical protein
LSDYSYVYSQYANYDPNTVGTYKSTANECALQCNQTPFNCDGFLFLDGTDETYPNTCFTLSNSASTGFIQYGPSATFYSKNALSPSSYLSDASANQMCQQDYPSPSENQDCMVQTQLNWMTNYSPSNSFPTIQAKKTTTKNNTTTTVATVATAATTTTKNNTTTAATTTPLFNGIFDTSQPTEIQITSSPPMTTTSTTPAPDYLSSLNPYSASTTPYSASTPPYSASTTPYNASTTVYYVSTPSTSPSPSSSSPSSSSYYPMSIITPTMTPYNSSDQSPITSRPFDQFNQLTQTIPVGSLQTHAKKCRPITTVKK